jgi:pimeloyl-ACP methyl ester carboxylesterase
MTTQLTPTAAQNRSVPANGIDIHYVEASDGEPLMLLHHGMVSTNPIWAPTPVSYSAHIEQLAERFRVIAPDTRGCGRTRHSGGTVTFELLADDVLALIDALGLDRPLIAGFSEGATTATIVGIRRPDSVRAIVNHAGYDFFNPQAPSFTIMRQMLGGSPEATEANPDAAAGFAQSPEMQAMFELLKADQDGAQGEGYWREYLRLAFHRTTRRLRGSARLAAGGCPRRARRGAGRAEQRPLTDAHLPAELAEILDRLAANGAGHQT